MQSLEILDDLIVDRRRAAPMHTQVEQALRLIIERHFTNGDAFFTEAQLVDRIGVSRPTVRQALAELTRDGMLLRRPSVGTIVVNTRPGAAPAKTQHVGVVLAEFESEYLAMLLQQIMIECRHRNFQLHSYYVHEGESAEQATQQISLGPEDVRVIVIAPLLLRWLVERGYRTVCIENPARNSTLRVVETDARMAVQMGVDYLRALGHERITLLVNEPAGVLSVQEKIDQFRSAQPQGQVVICGTQVWDNSYQAAYAHMSEVWNRNPAERSTALMTVSDPGAWAALRWLSEQGVSVPGLMSVLGFEDVRSSRFMHPSLSTIAHPIEAIARTAIEVLWEEDGADHQRRLAPNLMIRESTGPAPGV